MTMPSPFDMPELYQAIVVGGMTSPGIVKLSGHDREIGWDVKKGPGQAGVSTTRTSEDPVEFTASFYLVRDLTRGYDDIAAWPDFEAVLRSTVSGPEPKAIDVYHPDLASRDIKSVVLRSLGGAVHDGKGGVTIAVKLLEYRPPKAKGGSPSGSKAKATKKGPDPNAEANAELERLRKEYERTPWG